MKTFPLRKKYLYEIETTKGTIRTRLTQASMEDTQDYIELINLILESSNNGNIVEYDKYNDQFNDYILKILKDGYIKHSKASWYCTEKSIRTLIRENLNIYQSDIEKMLHTPHISIYKGHQPAISKESSKKGIRKQLFQNDIQIISENSRIPYDEVYKRFTYEQIGRWSDKLTFDYYETFDNGKLLNNVIVGEAGLNTHEQDLLKEIEKYSG